MSASLLLNKPNLEYRVKCLKEWDLLPNTDMKLTALCGCVKLLESRFFKFHWQPHILHLTVYFYLLFSKIVPNHTSYAVETVGGVLYYFYSFLLVPFHYSFSFTIPILSKP